MGILILRSSAGSGGGGSDLVLSSWRNSTKSLAWLYPATDANSSSHWRHRRAPAGIPWSIPLGIVGGGWPYNFDLMSSPTGMEIRHVGRDVGRPPFYSYLHWESPVAGTGYNVSVRARDQNGTSVTRSWTLDVYAANDTTKFLFLVSANGDTINDWYLSDEDDATYQNHQVFYTGDFDIGGLAGVSYDSGYQLPWGNAKPKTHVGIGAGATWHGVGAYPEIGTTQQGLYIADLTYDDPDVTNGTSVWNQHIKTNNTPLINGAIFRVTFNGNGTQPSGPGGANPSCIGLAEAFAAVTGPYCIVGCIADGVNDQALVQVYNALDALNEGWTVRNCETITMHHKGGDIRRWTNRGLRATENNTFAAGAGFMQLQWIAEIEGMERSDIEFSWSALNDSTAMGWFQEGNASDVQDRNEVFRCNLRVTHNETQANNGSLTFEDNLIQHSGTYTDGIRNTGSLVPTKTDNTTGTSGLINSTTGLAVSIDNAHGCEFTV